MMLKNKRASSPSSFLASSAAKRVKSNHRLHPNSLTRERKDKQLGDRIVGLQQLVSPYGKTDTASVLQEAIDYISFLHQQLKVLSSPYLLTATITTPTSSTTGALGSRGLCLVPLDVTAVIDHGANGADLWAPTTS
ncbi:Transcription factor bHLH153 [Linum perenne]